MENGEQQNQNPQNGNNFLQQQGQANNLQQMPQNGNNLQQQQGQANNLQQMFGRRVNMESPAISLW